MTNQFIRIPLDFNVERDLRCQILVGLGNLNYNFNVFCKILFYSILEQFFLPFIRNKRQLSTLIYAIDLNDSI
jgi:hypothetical protein